MNRCIDSLISVLNSIVQELVCVSSGGVGDRTDDATDKVDAVIISGRIVVAVVLAGGVIIAVSDAVGIAVRVSVSFEEVVVAGGGVDDGTDDTCLR